mgnify:CR=1 FL=1
MKNLIFFLLIPFSIFSQEISIKSKMDETKFENAVKSFEGYTYYNFDFVTSKTSPLNFEVIEKEYVNGKLKKESTYFDSKNTPSNLLGSTIPVTILAKSTSDANYRLLYQFYEVFNLNRNYDFIKEDRYSFKIFINETQKFSYNQKYLFSAIIKPIKVNETTYRNCDFSIATDKYDQWFEIFGLDRYFIYEIKFY